MRQVPLLSIVTVTWNCAATIQKTLASVSAIKNGDMEYIIIDGVSTDGTLEAIQSEQGLVDILVSEPDTGIYNAMNKGVEKTSGRYILFINGDDVLLEDGFDDVMQHLTNGDADIISAATYVGSRSTPDEVLRSNRWLLPFFNSVPHPSSFVKTDLLRQRPFDETFRIAADYCFFLQAFLSGKRFVTVDKATALHYRGGASGDEQQSRFEVDTIRRKCLGSVLYHLANLVVWSWRMAKIFIGPVLRKSKA